MVRLWRCLCTCCVRRLPHSMRVYLHPITHHIHTDHFISLSIFASFFRFRHTHTHALAQTLHTVYLFFFSVIAFSFVDNILFLRSYRCRCRRRPLRGLLFDVCSLFVLLFKICIDAAPCYCNRTHCMHAQNVRLRCVRASLLVFVQPCNCNQMHFPCTHSMRRREEHQQ